MKPLINNIENSCKLFFYYYFICIQMREKCLHYSLALSFYLTFIYKFLLFNLSMSDSLSLTHSLSIKIISQKKKLSEARKGNARKSLEFSIYVVYLSQLYERTFCFHFRSWNTNLLANLLKIDEILKRCKKNI